jgi:predicted nucleotidyltransferase
MRKMRKKDPGHDPVLRRIVRALREYGAERIIPFGSRARGDALPDSDYDVIVIRRTDRDFTQRLRDVVPYILRAGVRMDVIVYTPEEWEVVREGPFGETVLREGRVLYEKEGHARVRGSHHDRPEPGGGFSHRMASQNASTASTSSAPTGMTAATIRPRRAMKSGSRRVRTRRRCSAKRRRNSPTPATSALREPEPSRARRISCRRLQGSCRSLSHPRTVSYGMPSMRA